MGKMIGQKFNNIKCALSLMTFHVPTIFSLKIGGGGYKTNRNIIVLLSKLLASLMRNYFPKRPSGATAALYSEMYSVGMTLVFWSF